MFINGTWSFGPLKKVLTFMAIAIPTLGLIALALFGRSVTRIGRQRSTKASRLGYRLDSLTHTRRRVLRGFAKVQNLKFSVS